MEHIMLPRLKSWAIMIKTVDGKIKITFIRLIHKTIYDY